MRLLFDENLSFRLVRELADVYPDSAHVRDIGLLGAADQAVWAYAAQEGFLLTSKDTDFYQRSNLDSHAPLTGRLRCELTNLKGEQLELDLCFREIGNAC